jgi:cytochrome c
MSKRNSVLAAALLASMAVLSSAPALGQDGDAAKGEKEYRRCKTCHSLDEGTNGVGPSLYGIIGRQAGTVPDYNYSDSYVTAGEQGLTWTAENLIAYLEDPQAFLEATLGSDDVRTKMRNKFKKLELRQNIVAYLLSLFPPAE